MFDIILYDLDGTLTDPKEGITKSVQYALRYFGIEEEDLSKLEPFIGPPLKEQLMEYCGFEEEKGEEAVWKYRERFSVDGWKENKIYPGVADMLRRLSQEGKILAVASSKPTLFVDKILDYFEITKYFTEVVGSEMDGSRTRKSDVIGEVFSRLRIDEENKDRVVMIGDRKHDVIGAKEAGVASIGVTYGYGGYDELAGAHPDWIVNSVDELTELLLK